jgi:hypothetical protein
LCDTPLNRFAHRRDALIGHKNSSVAARWFEFRLQTVLRRDADSGSSRQKPA